MTASKGKTGNKSVCIQHNVPFDRTLLAMEKALQNFIAARQRVLELEAQAPMSLLSRRYADYAQAHFELRHAERILNRTVEGLSADPA